MPKAKEGISVSSLEEGDCRLLSYAYVALGAYLALGVAVYHLQFGWSLVDTLYVSSKIRAHKYDPAVNLLLMSPCL